MDNFLTLFSARDPLGPGSAVDTTPVSAPEWKNINLKVKYMNTFHTIVSMYDMSGLLAESVTVYRTCYHKSRVEVHTNMNPSQQGGYVGIYCYNTNLRQSRDRYQEILGRL